jgi:hypothetical protein
MSRSFRSRPPYQLLPSPSDGARDPPAAGDRLICGLRRTFVSMGPQAPLPSQGTRTAPPGRTPMKADGECPNSTSDFGYVRRTAAPPTRPSRVDACRGSQKPSLASDEGRAVRMVSGQQQSKTTCVRLF